MSTGKHDERLNGHHEIKPPSEARKRLEKAKEIADRAIVLVIIMIFFLNQSLLDAMNYNTGDDPWLYAGIAAVLAIVMWLIVPAVLAILDKHIE